jgi:hypothetical protein
MRWLLTLLCGVAAALIAINVGALFGLRGGFVVLVLVAPAIEEACKAMVCVFAPRKALVSAPWTLNDAIGLGLGFGVFEALVKWSPDLSMLDAAYRLPTVVMHVFVALLLVAEINRGGRHSAERGFVAALFWHGLYNAYIFVIVEIGAVGLIESIARLLVMLALFFFTVPMIRPQRAD